ncbi:MAG: radical SAM protein [Eubacteriales bacterium]|nr:radical SAM protein [Eubacteriales bacterium]
MKYYNIPIFVPHYGCPFDCVFCNQKHITGEEEIPCGARTTNIIREYLETLPEKDRQIEAAFFGGSFTAVDESLQLELLQAAYEFVKNGEIDGIRLSTRPDFIDEKIMERLVKYGVTTVELGVQSMNDNVLTASGRGHTAGVVEKAVGIIREYPVKLGLQMMTGLPEDTDERSIETANRIIALKPDFVRIYPTLVIRDTKLCSMYESGDYKPQSLDSAVVLAAKLMEMFKSNNIAVIRAGLAATDEISPGGALVAGPYHSAFGELAEGEVFYNKIQAELDDRKTAEIAINPKDISKAVGNCRRNIKRFEESGCKVIFVQDDKVPQGEIVRKD